jgi:hypothetical protein
MLRTVRLVAADRTVTGDVLVVTSGDGLHLVSPDTTVSIAAAHAAAFHAGSEVPARVDGIDVRISTI